MVDKEVKVIHYTNVQNDSKDSGRKDQIGRQLTNPIQEEEDRVSKKECLSRKNLIILIVSISACVIAAIIGVIIHFIRDDDPIKGPDTTIPSIPIEKLETEFEFNNKVNEPYRVNVQQKYKEEILTNGIKNFQFVGRNTNYDIFILNETNTTEATKNYYDKIYTAAILISSECIDTKTENCEVQQMIDLTKVSKRNLRTLEEISDLKDIPLPLCLFNLTDNDVITSMKCPESMPNNIRQNMILDLYFFRPPAIKRPDKEGNNVTIEKSQKDGKNFINEKNGGICDVSDPFESFCTTEMNTTTDLDGNVLYYDEIAFTNITHDENNSYIKNKITNLKDESEKMKTIDVKAYGEALNMLIKKVEPYLKYYEEFSVENFKELYKVSKNTTDDGSGQSRRNLVSEREEEGTENEQELFHYRHYSDINLFIKLKNDPGFISSIQKASLNFMVNEDKREITGSTESSNFNEIIKLLRDLSNAGNGEATKLYNNIKFYFDDLDDAIYDNITYLIDLIANEEKKSLSFIFDATLNMEELNIFPMKLVEESSNLKNNLNNLYNNIKNGGMKTKLSLLNNDIYSFLSTSHKLLDNIFQNVRSLSRLLKSSKSKLTEIATYYLNNTSDSYSDTAEKIQSLLNNYYLNEDEIINTAVDNLIGNFSNKLNNAIDKEKQYIDNLIKNLENNYENISIENGNEEDKDLFISNLKDSKDIINSILIKVEELIRKEMNVKENGHFITDYEISSINSSFSPDVKETYDIIKIMDNDETIDKDFDKTYGDLRENITKLMISDKKKIQENMVFLDDVLEKGIFSKSYKNDTQKSISNLGIKIIDSIRNENDDYVNKANDEIKKFIEKNSATLKELINNLTSILSDDSMEQYANLFDTAFTSCLDKLNKDIEKNKNLANNYFQKLVDIFNNDEKIKEMLQNFETDAAHLPYYLYYWSSTHYVYFTSFYDIIKSKSKTQAYINKYKKFKEQIVLSKEYINQQLQLDMKYEYKNTITKLKELLQIMKNSKVSDRFASYPELEFIDNNIKNLDNLYTIINNYFSDKKFNENYLPKINNYKPNSIKNIEQIDNNIIEKNHKIINQFKTVNDYNNDFCFAFLRKKTYTCTNGVIYHPDSSSNYCELLRGNDQNYNKLISLSIYSDTNFKKYQSSFNNFYSKIQNIVTKYTSLINEISQKLYSYENQAINTTLITGYLGEYNGLVEGILSKNYGNNLISATYDYYKKDSELRINTVFGDMLTEWKELFTNLNIEVNKNKEKYKNSITEFGILSIIYYNYLYVNISETYFDLMTNHEKREFNYTIAYYYSYLIKEFNSERQKILNKFPTNNIGFERVLEQRKKEINQKFDEIINIILESKKQDLSMYNQLYLLQVPETNFFQLTNLLSDFKKELKNDCEGITYSIYGLDNEKVNDLYSYISRFYKENSENGKEFNTFNKDLDNTNFIYLELDKFKDLLLKNWDFDRDDFIKSLNNTLLSNNAQIETEYKTKRESYKKTLEEEITKYNLFDKKNIIFKINNLYKESINELNQEDINKIREDTEDIVSKVIYYLSKEEERLKETTVSYYNDYSIINETIEYYKKKIFDNVDDKINEFINTEKELLEKEVYLNYYKKYLDNYIYYIEEETKMYENYSLLNSSYHIGNIINNIAQELAEEYEITAKNHIIKKAIDYYESMFDTLGLSEIKKYINNQINNEYNKLLSALKNKIIVDNQLVGYTKYDLSDEIKNEIDEHIKEKSENIIVIMNSIKGDKYNKIDIKNVIEWEIPDFSKISNTVHLIKVSFDSFIGSQKKYEDTLLKDCIQQVINSNFFDLLNNLIPSFGNDFFERIIAYNENFKIKSLYNNLGWSIASSISFIEILDVMNNIDQITKDLKIKLYRMNDLDSKILQNNKLILNLLDKKVKGFIFDSRAFIIQQYRDFLYNDANIEMAFSQGIIQLIKSVFESSTSQMQINYDNIIEKYLKEQLISSYKTALDEKTEEILRKISSQKEYLKIQLDDIKSIDSDEVLNEINNKINSTSEALNEYNNHFNTFNISDELIQFLYNYGYNEIHPSAEKFKTLVDNLYKDIIIINLDKNSEDYENSYDFIKFDDITNNTLEEIKTKYIDGIYESGHSYSDNYYDNLETKIDEVQKRRLDDEENIRIIADKSIDETFHKLLNNSLKLKNFYQSLEKLDEFDKKISGSINSLNSSYKESLDLIANNNYTEDIKNNLDNKLEELKNHSLEYYNNINESFYKLKIYLNESISRIDELLNFCANTTIETFEKKYSEILNKVNPINTMIKETIESFQDENKVKTQNYDFTVNTDIQNIKKEAKFLYNYLFEKDNINGIKIPEVNTIIDNFNRPEKVTFYIEKDITNCAKEIEIIEITFNNANYSVALDFNPNSQNIISKLSGLFEDYEYTVERYNTTDTKELICVGNDYNTISICVPGKCSKTRDQTLVPKYKVIVDKKEISDTFSIPE